MVNPFDVKTALLAKHAQHIVLIHFPVGATGLLAWQFQLEGQKLKGILLLHLVLACVSTAMIWLVWWVHVRARRKTVYLPSYRLALESLAVGLVALTGHLGGFLSGVNLPG